MTDMTIDPSARQVDMPLRSALITNRPFIIGFRTVLIVAAVAGILLLRLPSAFIYFTVQSNTFLIIVTGLNLAAVLRGAQPVALPVKGAATLYILITGLVYNIILAPTIHYKPTDFQVPLIGGTVSNDLLHLLTPLMALLDWLLFDPHQPIRWRSALIWLSYPISYLAFAVLRVQIIDTGLIPSGGTRYPYGFINADKIGYGGVVINTFIYGFAFWLLGLLLISTNRAIGRRMAKRQ